MKYYRWFSIMFTAIPAILLLIWCAWKVLMDTDVRDVIVFLMCSVAALFTFTYGMYEICALIFNDKSDKY